MASCLTYVPVSRILGGPFGPRNPSKSVPEESFLSDASVHLPLGTFLGDTGEKTSSGVIDGW